MDANLRIGLLYGGRSVEHQISIRSAKNIYENIDRSRFTPILFGISKEGDWFIQKEISDRIDTSNPVKLNLNNHSREFIDSHGISYPVDVVFPVLHGTDGEDGSVQGLLKVVNIPCVGSSVLGSAMSMNKWVTKLLLKQEQIPTADFIIIRKDDVVDPESLVNRLGLPLVLKPASLGSSVGVSVVKNKEEISESLSNSLLYDQFVIAEKYIKGREIECAILGNRFPESSLPGEIVISKNYEFYSFDAKYVDPEAAKLEIPAKIQPDIQKKIMELCVRTFEVMHCNDFARVDLFLTENGEIFINEINTIPGFTNSSMYPKLWENKGIPYQELISKLIDLAIERHREDHKITTTYSSKLDS